jgi:hypothetical protein
MIINRDPSVCRRRLRQTGTAVATESAVAGMNY